MGHLAIPSRAGLLGARWEIVCAPVRFSEARPYLSPPSQRRARPRCFGSTYDPFQGPLLQPGRRLRHLPAELSAGAVDYLADLCSATPARRALDCGCGTGQLAVLLARRFEQVIATDASAHQIENAEPHARVTYRVAPAERSGLPTPPSI